MINERIIRKRAERERRLKVARKKQETNVDNTTFQVCN